tara:strand:+ start:692 stop:1063 length:372 start_codon:yes stop_codon:yes gene_type:complete
MGGEKKKKLKPCPVTFKDNKQKYYYKNRKKCLAAQMNYVKNNPEKRTRAIRIDNWKRKGIIDTDFLALHEVYDKETHCWICNHQYRHTKERCLDHDHETGECRYICCITCNTKLLMTKYCGEK